MIMKYILTAIAGLILAGAVVWIFKICWQDMKKLLDALDEPENHEPKGENNE